MRAALVVAAVVWAGCSGVLELGDGVRACPSGEIRSARGRCTPAVTHLDLGGLPTAPAYDPSSTDYVVDVGAQAHELWIHFDAPSAVSVEVNGVVYPRGADGAFAGTVDISSGSTTLVVRGASGDAVTITITYASASASSLVGYVKAPLPDAFDAFGRSVDLGQGFFVVGAPNEDSARGFASPDAMDQGALDSGAAYVYRMQAGTIVPEVFLKADAPAARDAFGSAVAIDGSLVAVGAPGRDAGASNAGVVFVFERGASRWSLLAVLSTSNAGAGDGFGTSVDLDGDTLVVGAPGEASASADASDDSVPRAGAVYVFERSAEGFVETDYLKAPAADADDAFGTSVALRGGLIVVGAPGEDGSGIATSGDPNDDAANGAGAAYVYRRTAAGYAFEAYLKNDFAGDGDAFGASVATDGMHLAIGAPGDDRHGTEPLGSPRADDTKQDNGAVVLFDASSGAVLRMTTFDSPYMRPYLKLGASVAVDGTAIAAGMPGDFIVGSGIDPTDFSSGPGEAGSVLTFVDAGASWTLGSIYRTPALDLFYSSGDHVGEAIALRYGVLLGAGPYEDGSSAGVGGDPTKMGVLQSGCVFVWR